MAHGARCEMAKNERCRCDCGGKKHGIGVKEQVSCFNCGSNDISKTEQTIGINYYDRECNNCGLVWDNKEVNEKEVGEQKCLTEY